MCESRLVHAAHGACECDGEAQHHLEVAKLRLFEILTHAVREPAALFVLAREVELARGVAPEEEVLRIGGADDAELGLRDDRRRPAEEIGEVRRRLCRIAACAALCLGKRRVVAPDDRRQPIDERFVDCVWIEEELHDVGFVGREVGVFHAALRRVFRDDVGNLPAVREDGFREPRPRHAEAPSMRAARACDRRRRRASHSCRARSSAAQRARRRP